MGVNGGNGGDVPGTADATAGLRPAPMTSTLRRQPRFRGGHHELTYPAAARYLSMQNGVAYTEALPDAVRAAN